ncbi:hypothetical protein SMGD1_0231 [Sulfurimonas gotlandica GD1]|uniref:Uncharacterized protein n=1 Tax=Sulfurimonas gotlandica (strain DSM 19862 / JCM 16533 / GD1) TaxID=929558 RepID=H1FT22_SULGG|nr:hypothetical protein SMGD1_0231 [Sulfurimonas gotlandica GD1]
MMIRNPRKTDTEGNIINLPNKVFGRKIFFILSNKVLL